MKLREDLLSEKNLEFVHRTCLRLGFEVNMEESLDQLVDEFVEWFTSVEVFENQLLGLHEDGFDLFLRALKKQRMKIRPAEGMTAIDLTLGKLVHMDPEKNTIEVYEELRAVFEKIDMDVFRILQEKSVWLMKCASYASSVYGLMPVELLHKMYSLKEDDSIEEMVALFRRIPMDCVEGQLSSGKDLELKRIGKKHPLYSERGLFVGDGIQAVYDLNEFVRAQKKLSFYIPNEEEIEVASTCSFASVADEYQDLQVLLIDCMGFEEDEAMTHALAVYERARMGVPVMEILEDVFEEELDQELMDDEVFECLEEVVEHTRVLLLRGHTLEEVRDLCPSMCDEFGIADAPRPVVYESDLLMQAFSSLLMAQEDETDEEDGAALRWS